MLIFLKAIQREESYEEQIRDISARLKDVSVSSFVLSFKFILFCKTTITLSDKQVFFM